MFCARGGFVTSCDRECLVPVCDRECVVTTSVCARVPAMCEAIQTPVRRPLGDGVCHPQPLKRPCPLNRQQWMPRSSRSSSLPRRNFQDAIDALCQRPMSVLLPGRVGEHCVASRWSINRCQSGYELGQACSSSSSSCGSAWPSMLGPFPLSSLWAGNSVGMYSLPSTGRCKEWTW